MTDRSGDDALSWDGDDDPTLDVTARVDAEPSDDPDADPAAAEEPLALPDGYTAVGRGSETVGRIDESGAVIAPTAPAAMGNAALIGLGILGGVYGLFTIGWIIGGVRITPVAVFLVTEAAYVPALWLAVIAPAAWFAAAYLLTRDRAAWIRWTALIVGALVLIPWPFAMLGAIGR